MTESAHYAVSVLTSKKNNRFHRTTTTMTQTVMVGLECNNKPTVMWVLLSPFNLKYKTYEQLRQNDSCHNSDAIRLSSSNGH